MKKIYAVLGIFVLVFAVLMIAGCGKDGTTSSSSDILGSSPDKEGENPAPDYSEKSTPLEDIDVDDL